jgi:ribosomal protein S18 acetylase RimI-like enzyme
MIIRPMYHPSDLDFAAACTAAEEWASETRREFEGFFAYDPQGCFIAEEGGQPVGTGVATTYGEFGFVGELVVIPALRGCGIGRRLLEHAVEYLRAGGARAVYLDGVLAALPLYERAGFRRVCRSWRFLGQIPGAAHPGVRPMGTQDMEAVARLDWAGFGAGRRFFLERRLALYPELCWVLEGGGEVRGFMMGRRGDDWVYAGPWVVEPDVAHPEHLLDCFALQAGGSEFAIGVLEANEKAVAIMHRLGFEALPESPWRMVLGEGDLAGSPAQVFAIGSAAKG